ncbi:hypothetical protein QUB70_15165 [Microcoleus sp. A003_D6]
MAYAPLRYDFLTNGRSTLQPAHHPGFVCVDAVETAVSTTDKHHNQSTAVSSNPSGTKY